MDPFKPKTKVGPEAKIQEEVINFLKMRDWYVKVMHGSVYQSGFPDLFITHSKYRMRLVEIKNIEAYSFTAAQMEEFPKIEANGCGIWIMTAATEEEYKKLWRPPNWRMFLDVMRIRGQRPG